MSTNGKILVVSGIYPPDIGGPATYVPQICEQLVRNGYTVSVVSLEDEKHTSHTQEPWKRTFISRKHNNLLRSLLTLATLLKESVGCRAVFANGLYEEVGILKIFRPGLYLVAKVVGDPIWERDRNRTSSSVQIEEFNCNRLTIRNLIERKMLTWALNRFNVVSSPSLQIKELMYSWGVKNRIEIIQNGIKCKDIINQETKYDVVSVTRLVPWKNLDKLIIACGKAQLSVAVCGEGPEMDNLKKIAEVNETEATFLGQLESSEVTEVLNKSKIFALISSYEGLSFALLEAMMAGKRIIVSNCRGNIDVISNDYTGKIINVDDDSEIVSTLKALISDNEYNQNLSNNAHNIAKTKYCAEKQIETMIYLIVGRNE